MDTITGHNMTGAVARVLYDASPRLTAPSKRYAPRERQSPDWPPYEKPWRSLHLCVKHPSSSKLSPNSKLLIHPSLSLFILHPSLHPSSLSLHPSASPDWPP